MPGEISEAERFAEQRLSMVLQDISRLTRYRAVNGGEPLDVGGYIRRADVIRVIRAAMHALIVHAALEDDHGQTS